MILQAENKRTRIKTCSPLSTDILYGRLQRVTIPDVVIIQFVLLKMSIVLLETC